MAEEILRPNADLGDSYWDNVPGTGDDYTTIDEAVLDEDDYVYRENSYSSEMLAFPNTSLSTGKTINSVTIHGQCLSDNDGDQIRFDINPTGTHRYSGDIALGTSYADKSYQWALNPDDSEAWTSDDIDALVSAGLQTRSIAGTVRCAQLWIVIDYEEGAPAATNKRPRIMYLNRKRRTT